MTSKPSIAFIYFEQTHDEFLAVKNCLTQKGIKVCLVHLDEQVNWKDFDLVKGNSTQVDAANAGVILQT